MTKEEKEKLEKSIKYAKNAIAKGLILDVEERSQLYRMIDYYESKIEKEYKDK